MTVPELSTVTFAVLSLICRTSIDPSRWPSVSMQDCSLAGRGGWAGNCTFNNARLSPKIVVMPVSMIFGKGADGGSGCAGCGGLSPKTFLSGMWRYGLPEKAGPAALAAEHSTRLLRTQAGSIRGAAIRTLNTAFAPHHLLIRPAPATVQELSGQHVIASASSRRAIGIYRSDPQKGLSASLRHMQGAVQ